MAEKKPLCDFGKQIEIALIQKDKTNDWLMYSGKYGAFNCIFANYLVEVNDDG